MDWGGNATRNTFGASCLRTVFLLSPGHQASSPLTSSHCSSRNLSPPPSSNLLQLADKDSFLIPQPHTALCTRSKEFLLLQVHMRTHTLHSSFCILLFPVPAHWVQTVLFVWAGPLVLNLIMPPSDSLASKHWGVGGTKLALYLLNTQSHRPF